MSDNIIEYSINTDMRDLKHYLSEVEAIFDAETFVAEPRELYEPIDYTLRLGGKRIRLPTTRYRLLALNP